MITPRLLAYQRIPLSSDHQTRRPIVAIRFGHIRWEEILTPGKASPNRPWHTGHFTCKDALTGICNVSPTVLMTIVEGYSQSERMG